MRGRGGGGEVGDAELVPVRAVPVRMCVCAYVCLCVRVPVRVRRLFCLCLGTRRLRELRVALLSASSVFELQAPHQTALGHVARVCAVSDVAPGRLAPARMRAKSQDLRENRSTLRAKGVRV